MHLLLSFCLLTAPSAQDAGPPQDAGAPEGDGPGLVLEDIELTRADGETIVARRGILDVPNVRGRESSPMVQVEFHRFPCEDPESKAPPIFLLRGGPGFEGLRRDITRKRFYEDNVQRHTRIADLVVVGQRGIGSSTPNTACGGFEREALHERVTFEETVEPIAAACKECRERWEAEGYDLSGFNVIEAAADVIDVADALGYDRITLLGTSFGSHWGMTIMRFHEERVARAVLSGLEGPNHTYDMPSYVLAALERIAAAAEASDTLAEHVPVDGLVESFRQMSAALDEEPEVVALGTFEVLVDGRRLRAAALGTSGRTSSRRGIRTWPADMIRIARGDLKGVANFAMARNMGARLPTASFLSLDCGSGISAERLEQLRSDPACAVLGKGEPFYEAACPGWGADLGESFRENFETDVPTVLVQGNWDTSTPMENALELAPYFTNSRFVLVEGGSHGALREAHVADAGFRDALSAFLRTGTMEDIPETVVLAPLRWDVPED
ncbi:MAG: alpha/beta hydrolase [Planctomycetota bacterium]